MNILNLSYYPDITQKQSDEDVRNSIIIFANHLEENLSNELRIKVKVNVLDVMSVPEQYKDILNSNTHIALMKPVAYVLAHQKNESIVPACVAHRPIDGKVGTDYFAQIYARKDLGITTIKQLSNLKKEKLDIAYGNRYSTSNFLIPANFLKENSIHPFMFFKSSTFFGGHDFAAEAVYKGEAHVGAGHDGVIKILKETYPDAEDKLVSLGREYIHSDPIVVNKDNLPSKISFEDIQLACTNVAKIKEVQDALELFWGWVKDLSPTLHENYYSIEKALLNLNLTENDILE